MDIRLLWLKLIRIGRYLLIPLYLVFAILTFIHFQDTGEFDKGNFAFWTIDLAATFLIVRAGERWIQRRLNARNII